MKKKQITSKLKFQKTTVVSFKTMKNIMGRSFVNTDTIPISRQGISCQTLTDCVTQNGLITCITCTGEDCDHPTTRTTLTLVDCGPDGTRQNCIGTRNC